MRSSRRTGGQSTTGRVSEAVNFVVIIQLQLTTLVSSEAPWKYGL